MKNKSIRALSLLTALSFGNIACSQGNQPISGNSDSGGGSSNDNNKTGLWVAGAQAE